jgi:hypothetical protein
MFSLFRSGQTDTRQCPVPFGPKWLRAQFTFEQRHSGRPITFGLQTQCLVASELHIFRIQCGRARKQVRRRTPAFIMEQSPDGGYIRIVWSCLLRGIDGLDSDFNILNLARLTGCLEQRGGIHGLAVRLAMLVDKLLVGGLASGLELHRPA